jgi:hypothetical protein
MIRDSLENKKLSISENNQCGYEGQGKETK